MEKAFGKTRRTKMEKKDRFCPPGELWEPKITIKNKGKMPHKIHQKSIFRGPSGPFFASSGPSGSIFHFFWSCGAHFPFSGPCGAFPPIFRALRGLSPDFSGPAGPLSPPGAHQDLEAWASDPEKKRIPMKKKRDSGPAGTRKKSPSKDFLFSQP